MHHVIAPPVAFRSGKIRKLFKRTMSENGTRTWLQVDGLRVSLTRERNPTKIQVYRTVCAVRNERQ